MRKVLNEYLDNECLQMYVPLIVGLISSLDGNNNFYNCDCLLFCTVGRDFGVTMLLFLFIVVSLAR